MATMDDKDAKKVLKAIPSEAKMLLKYFPPDHPWVGWGHCPGCFMRVLAELPETE